MHIPGSLTQVVIADQARDQIASTAVGDNAVQCQDLRKSFGAVKAVQGVSFVARRGEIVSLLGPNGAGKSTTIAMLACLLRPSSGDALVMGHSIVREPMAVKAAIGLVPQDIAIYADLNARENLMFWGRMYGLRGKALARRVDEVLDIIGLKDRQREAVGHYSGGMKRRVNIGIALMHRPPVLILDEPTVGIDPQSRRHILDSVKELNRQGTTVLYTTHYMEEAQELSHHIAVMDKGQIIAQGTHDELVQLVGELDRVDLSVSADRAQIAACWQNLPGVRHLTFAGGVQGASGGDGADNGKDARERPSREVCQVSLLVDDSDLVLPRLFESAARVGASVTAVSVHEPNLEAVFLHLTGRALRDQ